MTQPLDNPSLPAVAPSSVTAELSPSPAPGGDTDAPIRTAGLGGRTSAAKKPVRGRVVATVPTAPGAPAKPANVAGPTEPTPPFRLNSAAVAGAVGLGHEVTLLRAAIRHLAEAEDAAPHVKTLAELRHQVEALCTALKTQHALDGRGDTLSADLARALEELGDELGVPR